MKALLSILFVSFFFVAVSAQDINALLKEGYRLEAIPNEKASFQKFKEVLKLHATNIYALNKCSELCTRIGQRETNEKLRSDYYTAAKIYAETALKVDPNNSDANCAMAMALGRNSMSKSAKEKLATAREVKKYADKSVKFDAQNWKAWHVLGRWNYELSNLNAVEKTVVKVFYGGMPPASLKESINAFERARALRPEFLLNYLEMAKAYKENNNKARAISYLNLMFTLPIHTEDDVAIKEKGRAMLKEWD
jgi:tetratricopeptide (TPR) repeat protein